MLKAPYTEEGTESLLTGKFAGRRQHKAEKGIIPMDENESLYGAEAEEVVTPQDADDAAQDAEGAESSESPEQSRQTHEDNRRYQAARRAGEDAGYQRAMEEMSRRFSKLGMRDPATGETITNIEGLEAYSKAARKQQIEARAKAEGRSVAEVTEEEDNRDFLREQRAEAAARKKQDDEKAALERWVAQDAAAFAEAYPDVDIAELDGNKAFRRFCGSRYGREPLAGLYEDWLDITGAAGKAAAARSASKSERSTGTGGGSGSETLTASQQRALEEWNRNYPNMKMTAKEFLSRKG